MFREKRQNNQYGIRVSTVEQTTRVNSISEFQEHVKEKKLDTKQYILHDAICVKFKNNHMDLWWQKQHRLAGEAGAGGADRKGVWGIFCILIVVWVTWTCVCQNSGYTLKVYVFYYKFNNNLKKKTIKKGIGFS